MDWTDTMTCSNQERDKIYTTSPWSLVSFLNVKRKVLAENLSWENPSRQVHSFVFSYIKGNFTYFFVGRAEC